MNEALKQAALPLIEAALREDWGERGDITGEAVGIGEEPVEARIIAKQEGVVCGMDVTAWVFQQVDERLSLSPAVADGAVVTRQQVLMHLFGSAKSILAAERTALNFLGRLSGIATLTNHFVKEIAGTACRILDTRKTAPGWRLLDKYAVRCGGGTNHRIGLYDMFLIKENHIAAAGGMAEAVRRCRDYMMQRGFAAAIEVEARTPDEAEEAAKLGVDRIMLDNMSVEQIAETVRRIGGRVPLEASGNVSLASVRRIAETGVDFISVGALTHSAPVFDVSLLFSDISTAVRRSGGTI